MGPDTKVTFSMIRRMAKEFRLGLTVLSMMESGKMVGDMELEPSVALEGVNILDLGKMENSTEKANLKK